MSRAPLVVVGDVLLDREVLGRVDRLCPEAPVPVFDETEVLDRPGGAGLAAVFAASAAASGPPGRTGPGRPPREVVLVAAVSADPAGDRIRELLARAGVRLVEVPLLGPTPEKIRLRAGGHLLMRLDRGSEPGEIAAAPAEAIEAIRAAGAILVSDYGRGVCAHPQLRAALTERAQCMPLVWDPHPRGGQPVPATRLATPNRAEAIGFVSANPSGTNSGEWPVLAPLHAHVRDGAQVRANGNGHAAGNGHGNEYAAGNGNGNGRAAGNGNGRVVANGNGRVVANGNGHGAGRTDPATADLAQAAGMAVRLRRYWAATAVVVTLDDRGAVLSDGVNPPLLVPTPFSARGDSCGAGDRFASAAVASLAEGSSTLEAVTTAVTAATAYVAAGGALALCPELHERADDPSSAVII
ncbi:PfkB family carbohydrate kinase [Planosporangium sp. 12N6]|uniref:PfkB family carbohydrate kinase n=1 Tax=Planosporangium spinosum TaxID=3402278 RepID=UPI003CE6B299